MGNTKEITVCDGTAFKWTYEGETYALRVGIDDFGLDPRKDEDNLAVMACWSRKYNLGDELDDKEPEGFWRRLVRENVPDGDVLKAALDGKFSGIRIAPNEERPELLDIYEVDGKQEYLACGAATHDYAADPITDLLEFGDCMKLLAPYAAWMPLWLMEHSGSEIRCSREGNPFADPWDSGQIGWIILLKKTVMEEIGTEYVLDELGQRIRVEYPHPNGPSTWGYKTRPLTDDTWRPRAYEAMETETERYADYHAGRVFWYTVYKEIPGEDGEESTWEELDTCGGFYGTDILKNGMADQVGYGFWEAVESGQFEEGRAEEKQRTYMEFHF